ncbi:MAG: methyltransferase family protein [Anaerolineae bacterium]
MAVRALALALSGMIFYVGDFLLMHRFDRQRSDPGSGRSWGYTIFVIGAFGLLVAQPLLIPDLGLQLTGFVGAATFAVGVAVVALGLALYFWSRWHLGHYYVEDVVVQADHRVVDTGPYAAIRHPAFTSFFLIVGGFLLINPSVLTVVAAGYTMIDFTGAAKREERLLSEEVVGYQAYMEHTGRFLPPLRRGQQFVTAVLLPVDPFKTSRRSPGQVDS